MVTNKARGFLSTKEKVFRVFDSRMELSLERINEKVGEIFGEKIHGNGIPLAVLDLINEGVLTSRNGSYLPAEAPEDDIDKTHIKLFSICSN